MTKPITVKEAKGKMLGRIPDFVIEAFNELIGNNVSKESRNEIDIYTAKFTQEDVLYSIINHCNREIEKEEIFKNKWLDIEDIYKEMGWKVTYNKPAYNESGKASFTFEGCL